MDIVEYLEFILSPHNLMNIVEVEVYVLNSYAFHMHFNVFIFIFDKI